MTMTMMTDDKDYSVPHVLLATIACAMTNPSTWLTTIKDTTDVTTRMTMTPKTHNDTTAHKPTLSNLTPPLQYNLKEMLASMQQQNAKYIDNSTPAYHINNTNNDTAYPAW